MYRPVIDQVAQTPLYERGKALGQLSIHTLSTHIESTHTLILRELLCLCLLFLRCQQRCPATQM